MVLSLEQACFRDGSEKILDNITFGLPSQPSVTTVIGPNGAGKSTLLKLCAGLLKPSAGLVNINTKTIGYMPQDFFVHPWLPIRVGDFLLLEATRQNIQEALKMLDVQPFFLRKPLSTLSFGERKLILFIKAVLKNPALLVLDEPVTGLDLENEERIYKKINWLCNTKSVSVIMASHNLHTVFKKSCYIICLNKAILCQGPTEKIRNSLASLPKNVRPYAHQHNT